MSQVVIDQIIEAKAITDDQVATLKTKLYDDGVIDREEADNIFAINDAISGTDGIPASWLALFSQAVADHVLKDEATPGVVDDDEAVYVIGKIEGDGVVDAAELGALVAIISQAESCPPSLIVFTMESAKAQILEDGVIDADEVKMISDIIYGSGGDAGEGVSRVEADWLFELNDAVSGNANHESWADLFIKAIYSHVTDDDESPGVIDQEESDWLVAQVQGDGSYDDVEKALFAHIKDNLAEDKYPASLKMQLDLILA